MCGRRFNTNNETDNIKFAKVNYLIMDEPTSRTCSSIK